MPKRAEVLKELTGDRAMKLLMPRFQEKRLSDEGQRTVLKTDTGGRIEYIKALERTMLKELGKLSL